MNLDELFWSASVEEISKGYIYDENSKKYICLLCGETYEKGVIYQNENRFYEAMKYVEIHIEEEHDLIFSYLINMSKKYTGLTDHQKQLLKFFYQELTDKEIVNEIGGGSTATIRNHRFKLKEKEKQAKIFLAIMRLLKNNLTDDKNISIPKGAKMVDERFNITEKDREKVLNTYFDESNKLTQFPSKEKKKIIILQEIIKDFEHNRQFTEKEVNEVIKKFYDDFVTIRRYFIEYGFMDRTIDGSAYWVKI